MHSGNKRTGPKGADNAAYRHGNETQEAIAERKRLSSLLRALKTEPEPSRAPTDWMLMADLLEALGIKETRAMRRLRNRDAWASGDRRSWGGEDRRGWPKRPGRNGYRWQRRG